MRPSQRKALLYQSAGVGLYLVGLVLFLSVAVSVFGSEGGAGSMTGGQVVMLVASIVTITAGRRVTHRYGLGEEGFSGLGTTASPKPEQSRLEELGYHIPPEAKADDDETDTGDATVLCSSCGTPNDDQFTFCSECSAELPE